MRTNINPILRQKRILELLDMRYTYEEIGKMLVPKISAQRVHQIAIYNYKKVINKNQK